MDNRAREIIIHPSVVSEPVAATKLNRLLGTYRRRAQKVADLCAKQAEAELTAQTILREAGLNWCTFWSTHPCTPVILPQDQVWLIITNCYGPGHLSRCPGTNFYLFQICPACLADLRDPNGSFPDLRHEIALYLVLGPSTDPPGWIVQGWGSDGQFTLTRECVDQLKISLLAAWSASTTAGAG